MSDKAWRWPRIQLWRDPERHDLGLRLGLDPERPTEGFPELETYLPESEVSALRKEWEEELLSDEAVNAAWDVVGPALPAGYVAEAIRSALAAIKQESDRG